MRYTNELSKIDTTEKAYLLGLLVSDGTIHHNKQSGAYCTTLKLKESDKPLLEEIINIFPFFKLGKVEIHKDGFRSYYINHYNKQLFLDLQKNSVLTRKSYENANNVWLPEFSEDLFFAYLHGLFDGDGTIQQSKKGHIRIDVIGKCKNLLEEIHKKLLSFGIKNRFYYREKRDYWMIRLSTKPHVKTLIEKFSSTPLCLERKFKPFFNVDWDRIPGYDNAGKSYPIWFANDEQTQTSPP